MGRRPKLFIAILRIALGWLFLYQGYVAFTDPAWSLATYIGSAKTFPAFYSYILTPALFATVSSVIKFLFVAVGGLLVLGIFARPASIMGIALMLFFYFPILNFPLVDGGFYVIDSHIIYILILAYLFMARGSEYFGLGSLFRSSRY